MTIREKIEHAITLEPCTVRDLKKKFGGDKDSNAAVMKTLDNLVRSGVVCQRHGVFFTVRSGRANRVVLCTVSKVARTFGFAAKVDGSGDIFIPGRGLRGAMTGDKVLVERFEHPRVAGSDEGEIVAIVEPKDDLVGTVRRIEGRLQFVPDDCPNMELTIAHGCGGGAKDGEKVGAAILRRGTEHEDHLVEITVRFGSADDAKHCAQAMLYAQGITPVFPSAVRQEAEALEDAVVTADDTARRIDLRSMAIFTIDSAETKDIDDAISIRQTNEGFELGVHIADVSHYVHADSALDQEAFARGTSVYYADQVVPMLPKQLSNGICSLNEGVDRLAFSCLMRLDANGNLKGYRFAKTVIRSKVKGVYSEINALLAGQSTPALQAKYAPVAAQLPAMHNLYLLRAAHRAARGCMDIESGECKLILDENGRCIDVKKRTSGESESIIEEFMLLANQCAAHFARTKQAPFVYRVHEQPNAEKLERLHALLQSCALNDRFAAEVPTPKELSVILEKVRDTAYEKVVHTGLLRCMAKAKYEHKAKGHYGLVLKDYAHFTSPIRRYPDLAIHRILTDLISGVPSAVINDRYNDFVEQTGKQASEREVVATQIERGVESCYKAEYARQHLGERYEGVISGVTQKGLFIELPNGVEGFVAAADLTPGGTYLTEGVRLSDPLTGRNWNLGDSLMVVIARADVNAGKVDFDVVR